MKKIETDRHLSYTKIVDVVVDNKRLYSETLGKDENGNIILHKSSTYNMGGGYGENSEYYILTPEEYASYGVNRKPKNKKKKKK